VALSHWVVQKRVLVDKGPEIRQATLPRKD
jgi:hypothetical protein